MEINEIRNDKPIKTAKVTSKPESSIRIRETASALRGFARVFRIEGIDGFCPDEFMRYVKPEVLKLMRENRQKIRFVFNPEMMKHFESEDP